MAEPVRVPDAVADPAGFVLAACDLRERRAKAATNARWKPYPSHPHSVWQEDGSGDPGLISTSLASNPVADAEHIAAEANPAHALAEVALWRGIVERHEPTCFNSDEPPYWYRGCPGCRGGCPAPCPDLLAVVAAARAYLTGAR